MIPFVALVSVRGRESKTFRLWIPLLLVWLLLVPVAVLVSPLVFVVCLVCRVNPFRGVSTLWQILSALNHTEVDVDHGGAGVSVYVL